MSPRDFRRAAVAFLACFALGAGLAVAFVVGQDRAARWCDAHPDQARRASTCAWAGPGAGR